MGFALMVTPVATANAQFSVGLGLGGVFLQGDAGDAYGSGWLVGLFGAYRFGDGQSPVSVRLDLMHSEHKVQESLVNAGAPSDLKLKNNYGLAYLVVHILPPEKSAIDLYFGGGGGFVGINESAGGQSISSTEAALSGLFGIAIPVGGGNIRIFAEGKWVTIFTEGGSTNVIPVEAGVAIGF